MTQLTQPAFRPRILFVDDESSLREVLVELVVEALPSAEIFQARDGREALDQIQKTRFDLVVSDVRMPRMGGVELLDASRGIQPDLAFIFMSAFGDGPLIKRALELGVASFIDKPFKSETALATILTHLEVGIKRRRIFELLVEMSESGTGVAQEKALEAVRQLRELSFLLSVEINRGTKP